MKIELYIFLKIDFFGQIEAWGTFQDFSQVFFCSLFLTVQLQKISQDRHAQHGFEIHESTGF